MNTGRFLHRLEQLARKPCSLYGGLIGLEKESLRLTTAGRIAQTPHPKALGSPLTHPYITTDYSEALLEFITPPCADGLATLAFLDEIHRFVCSHLQSQEALLATSMPIGFKGDEDIPIACYGLSNIGRMKYVYRVGLSYRYGRAMQAIAGIHYNYSVAESLWPILQEALEDDRPLQEFKSAAYFGLIRNLKRYGWLLLYLFGASPVVSRPFLECRGEIPAGFVQPAPDTYGLPYATSLRMSDIGYKNPAQADLHISCNTLEEYTSDLCRAIETPFPPYQAIGVKVDGDYRQLNANVLQIENEYYSIVRPKQVAERDERPTVALRRRGVRYIEVRALDLNPYEPLGIDRHEIHFLEAFLLYCLLQDSPPHTLAETQTMAANLLATAQRGRDPKLTLIRAGQAVSLREWAEEFCTALSPLCQLLDAACPGKPYQTSLELCRERILNPNLTPSAKIWAQLSARKISFADFALEKSLEHTRYFRQRPLPEERLAWFTKLSVQSIREQERIEAEDVLSFDEFLKRYFKQTCQIEK
ncbi:MAG: glutamate--cysteine ligase [Methylohalobius sp.]|nr:glutamate--cysteine ligase [Methylohalobius sp.]